MDDQTFKALFHSSEVHRSNGNFHEALQGYMQLLQDRLNQAGDLGEDFSNYESLIIERLADLSLLLNYTVEADLLLEGLQLLYQQLSNEFMFFYIAIKRSNIALEVGEFETAKQLLELLDPYIGNIDDISFSEMHLWERQCKLPVHSKDENTLLFSRLYYILGGLLSKLGQYNDAILCYDRLLLHIEEQKPTLISQIYKPTQVQLGRAYLEKGDLANAQTTLAKVETDPEAEAFSGLYINLLQLKAKISLMTGKLGDAQLWFSQIWETCKNYKLPQAEVVALTNLANLKIYLNQVMEAENLLEKAFEIAVKDNNPESLNRIKILRSLAVQRSTSQVLGVSVMPTISEIHQYPKSDSVEQAETTFELPEIQQTDSYLTYFEDRELICKQLLAYQEYEQALQYFYGLFEVFQHSDSDLIHVRLSLLAFTLAYYLNDFSIFSTDPGN